MPVTADVLAALSVQRVTPFSLAETVVEPKGVPTVWSTPTGTSGTWGKGGTAGTEGRPPNWALAVPTRTRPMVTSIGTRPGRRNMKMRACVWVWVVGVMGDTATPGWPRGDDKA